MRDKPVVYLLDDDEGMRTSLTHVLTEVGLDVLPFASPAEFFAAYEPEQPGCLVFDVQLPELSGMELLKELQRRGCPHPFLIISGHGTVTLAVEAMRCGAIDFLEKPFHPEQFIARVREALERDALTRQTHYENLDFERRVGSLTPRERQVMQLVVDGRLTKQIAKELGISTKTVEVHRSNVTKKMGVASVAQLVKLVTTVTAYSASHSGSPSPNAGSSDIAPM